MDQTEAVLFANDRFYYAFSEGSYEEMETLWAQGVAMSCLHPGHPPLFGREDILYSWQLILSEGGTAGIECKAPEVSIYGDLATVVCYESLAGGYLVATNMYLLQQDEWRMIHHQAGPTAGEPQTSDELNDDVTN